MPKRVAIPLTVGVGLLDMWASRLANVGGMRYELTANALMLLPVGFLLPAATSRGFKESMALCLALTVGVESAQYLAARGTFEISDVVLNMLGAIVGYGLFVALRTCAWLARRVRARRG